MLIARMKAKNQLTIPSKIVKKMRLNKDELFSIDIGSNYIKLTPVEIDDKYSSVELATIDRMVEKQKNKAKIIRPGKDFLKYVKKINK